MSPARPLRFYKTVNVAPRGVGFEILLDGKPVKTPAGAPLALPNAVLASAVAEEWRTQGQNLRPETMFLTKLSATAIDRVGANRRDVIAQIVAFGHSDVLCYRAAAPAELVARQAEAWDPWLHWARMRWGAPLQTGTGIGFIAQPESGLHALETAVASQNDFRLTVLHGGASLCGSLILSLALLEGAVSAETAFAVGHLDEIYQAEKWGSDSEALAQRENKVNELKMLTIFLQVLGEEL